MTDNFLQESLKFRIIFTIIGTLLVIYYNSLHNVKTDVYILLWRSRYLPLSTWRITSIQDLLLIARGATKSDFECLDWSQVFVLDY